MKNILLALLVLIPSVCSGNPLGHESWERYTFDLSGKRFSFSAPKGQFRSEYVSQVDLLSIEKPYTTLFKSAWVFSGPLADKGALDFIVGLNRVESNDSEEGLVRAIQNHFSEAYKKLLPQGVKIQNISRRQLGGKEWLCYSVSDMRSECALRIDERHYISWDLADINNTASEIGPRNELRSGIEKSLEFQF